MSLNQIKQLRIYKDMHLNYVNNNGIANYSAVMFHVDTYPQIRNKKYHEETIEYTLWGRKKGNTILYLTQGIPKRLNRGIFV